MLARNTGSTKRFDGGGHSIPNITAPNGTQSSVAASVGKAVDAGKQAGHEGERDYGTLASLTDVTEEVPIQARDRAPSRAYG